MDQEYLIDSNAVIDFLAGNYPLSGNIFMNHIINNVPVLSVITKIEILGFNSTDAVESLFKEFIEASYIMPLSDSVVQKTIEIRKMLRIKLVN